MWLYAGSDPPKSYIIPYLLSVRLPRGPVRSFPDVDPRTVEAEVPSDSTDSGNKDRKLLCKELALELKSRKIDFVRCWFQWNFFEPTLLGQNEEEYQFPLDDFVLAMTEENIQILGVLANGYSRFLPSGLNTQNANEYVSRMQKMASAVLAHYKDHVTAWQIENEPNWWEEHYATHWRSGGIWLEPATQELILSALHNAVSTEVPDATIIINLEADNRRTDWKFYAKYCDVLGLDFYPNYFRSSPVDPSEVKFASDVKKITGLTTFIAETGYPSGPELWGYNRIKQAEYVRAVCTESFACEDLSALALWRYSDSYWRSFPFQENYFGLLTKEGLPKPAWLEYHEQIIATH